MAIPAVAQTHYNSNISIGAKAGVDLSRIFFNPSVKQDFKPGMILGGQFRYIEENHFGLIAEINFAQRGWKEKFDNKEFAYSRTIDYLMVPVLAHIYFGRRGRFFANIGPEIGFLLGDKVSSNFDEALAPDIAGFDKYHTTQQYTEPVKQKVDYGIAAGLGGEFNINRRNSISAEVRFYYGLGNLFSSARKDYFNASNSMNLEFSVGYWFRVK